MLRGVCLLCTRGQEICELVQVLISGMLYQPDCVGLLHALFRFEDFQQSALDDACDGFFLLRHARAFLADAAEYRRHTPF
jgi:hypothetical protein